jgi:hypothetical protein
MFTNTYGIEIECYLPEGGNRQHLAAAITSRLGAAGACHEQDYNHITQLHWKIVTDGSLGDYSRGVEIVSPVLSGEAGLEAIGRVMNALTDYGCTVSRRCGLHIHVGVGAASTDFFKAILKAYGYFEPVIDGFMPPSRRASANMYCRSVTHLMPGTIDQATSLNYLINLMASHGGEARYHKLNLIAYRRHQTVEFRQHSGTLEASKAVNWTKLCLRLVAAAQAGKTIATEVSATTVPMNRARPGSKGWQVGQMMLRPEGVTGAEAMAATGWPSISLPQQARACGIGFTTQRTGREVRYFAQAAQASTQATPATLDGLLDWAECADGERAYFRGRAQDLSGPTAWAA